MFVPAGLAHTYEVVAPSRDLIGLTPKLARLIDRLRRLEHRSQPRAVPEEFATVMVE